MIAHFTKEVATLSDLLPQVEDGRIDAVWVAGGYKTDWIEAETAQRLGAAELVVVQDLFASPLTACADYILPAAAFAEREGSYVNCHDRLQSFAWAIRPPQGVRVEASLYWQLLGRPGLYQAGEVLQEMAGQVPYFYAAAGEVADVGVDLKGNQLV
ncbi:MAG: molybdopterin-dependent oxidoreductase [Planctomycetales bacterium]|nr:molybdopterin-dependent oxidoreductase [Planctomycetales bacterium]